jgi:hypothetical protein
MEDIMTEKPVVALFYGDTHSGHECGLTPPDWQSRTDSGNPHIAHIAEIQNKMWKFFTNTIKQYGPFDVAVGNGDLIDGRGERSGGTEQLYADRKIQADMAIQVVKTIGAKKNYLIRGTGYHVSSDGEDWEDLIASSVGADIKDHAFIDINGWVFDCKHHLGSSSVPYARNTALSRDRVWSQLWHEREMVPKSHFLVRSHVHYAQYYETPDGANMTLPCLQFDSKYGKRRCSGTIDLGVVIFKLYKDNVQRIPVYLDMRFAKAQVLKA